MAFHTPLVEVAQWVTGEELAKLPEADLCELVDGKVVRMSPTSHIHGRIEGRVYRLLSDFVESKDLGQVMVGEVGIYIRRNPDTIRAADVLYISQARYAQSRSASYLDVAPELVVEVLSPDDSWQAVTRKLADYFSIGVQMVWVVDPDAHQVYAYRSATESKPFAETDTLTAPEVLPGLTAPVAEVFR